MPALSEYTNVYNTALIILKKKGYSIWIDTELNMFCAEKDGWDFKANSPCGLLGLISIYEWKSPQKYQEYWWRENGEDLYSKLSKIPPSYTPVYEKK